MNVVGSEDRLELGSYMEAVQFISQSVRLYQINTSLVNSYVLSDVHIKQKEALIKKLEYNIETIVEFRSMRKKRDNVDRVCRMMLHQWMDSSELCLGHVLRLKAAMDTRPGELNYE